MKEKEVSASTTLRVVRVSLNMLDFIRNLMISVFDILTVVNALKLTFMSINKKKEDMR